MEEIIYMEISETNRGTEQVIINKKNINLILYLQNKKIILVYRYTEYKNFK